MRKNTAAVRNLAIIGATIAVLVIVSALIAIYLVGG